MFRGWWLILLCPGCLALIDDPAPGFFMGVKQSRRLVCDPAPLQVILRQNPGRLDEEKPRGDFANRNVMTCEEVVMGEGDRAPQDRAVLDRLAIIAAEIAKEVANRPSDSESSRWLVEAHHPSAAVSAKIVFAAKTAMVQRGLNVTDRLPPLAVGDVQVLARMPPTLAYAAACRRYFSPKRLKAPDAVLGIVLLDRRETDLHAGTCENGQWTWVR